ncbi:MAG: DUF935 domain-containing protein [Pseudomonadota bacterium]
MAIIDRLKDTLGKLVSRGKLKQEQGGPTTRGVRSPYGDHPAAGLTPARLASILRESIEGDPERYLELAEDMEERDLHYAGVLSTRKRQVAGLEITVDAASEDPEDVRAADMVREITERDAFQEELVDVLDAIGKGFSCTEIMWETSGNAWYPEALKWRDPRWFTFDPDDMETIRLRGVDGDEDLHPFKWIVHRAKVKSGLTIRGGIARGAAWSFMFKAFTARDWAIFCETYGQPLKVGKYGSSATDVDKEALMRAVASIGVDFAAIIPESMQLEFIEAKLAGNHELFEKRSNFLDYQVSKLVLGQTGTTDAIAGGHAVGKVHDEVREDIEKSDCRQLCATLNRDLVKPYIDLNRGPRLRYPRLRIGRPDEVDVTAFMDNVEKFVNLGGEVPMAPVRDKIGLPEPRPDEKLLTATPVTTDAETEEDQAGEDQDELETSLHDHDHDDAVSQAADRIAADGWEPLVGPVVRGLKEELASATSIEEARSIIERRRETMDVGAMTDLLAQMAFGARISGETEEPLSDEDLR